MSKFRKIPVVIDAVQWEGSQESVELLGEMTGQPGFGAENDGDIIVIQTLEGDMRAGIGDWIIKGVKGELYPCKDDIFRMTYEPEGCTNSEPMSCPRDA